MVHFGLGISSHASGILVRCMQSTRIQNTQLDQTSSICRQSVPKSMISYLMYPELGISGQWLAWYRTKSGQSTSPLNQTNLITRHFSTKYCKNFLVLITGRWYYYFFRRYGGGRGIVVHGDNRVTVSVLYFDWTTSNIKIRKGCVEQYYKR